MYHKKINILFDCVYAHYAGDASAQTFNKEKVKWDWICELTQVTADAMTALKKMTIPHIYMIAPSAQPHTLRDLFQ